MPLNADFDQRVVIRSKDMALVPSMMPGGVPPLAFVLVTMLGFCPSRC